MTGEMFSIREALFFLVFLSQVVLISYFLPKRLLDRVRYIFKTYPPSDYPNLYPEPIEKYEKAQRNFWYMNLFILVIGLVLFVATVGYFRGEDWNDKIVGLFFVVQFIPMILMERWTFKYYKLMRQNDSRATRSAELNPRRLFDFVSPVVIGVVALVYFAFIVLIAYIDQFNFPWFGGYWNVVGVTGMNLFFAGIVLWNLYGKKRDPYQTYEDRRNQIELVVKQLVFVSIVATLYMSLQIIFASLELRLLQPIFTSLYLQLIAVICLRAIRVEDINFEVYKEEPATT